MTKPIMAAYVFLRSVSGKSIRELSTLPLPEDLAPFRASPSVRNKVTQFFRDRGFDVYEQDDGLALSITGSANKFVEVFQLPEARLLSRAPSSSDSLPIPPELAGLVEEVCFIPPVEIFPST